MPPSSSDEEKSQSRSHAVRDGVIAATVFTAEVLSGAQGVAPHVIPTPTDPVGRPLITQDERDAVDSREARRKQEERELFDLGNALRQPEQVEQRDRDTRSER